MTSSGADTSRWRVEEHDGIVVAAYDAPPMNYLTSMAAQELCVLIERWRDPAVKAVVLTGGVDGRFITHFSVEELLASMLDRERLIAAGTAFTDAVHAYRWRLSALPKPVIAAMNGDTMGAGLEVSLSCDVRIGQAGDHRYGFPEVRLGIMPSGTGTQRLSRLIGVGRAIELILRGRIVDPETALRLGMINEVVDDARARAVELAHELARRPAEDVAASKGVIPW